MKKIFHTRIYLLISVLVFAFSVVSAVTYAPTSTVYAANTCNSSYKSSNARESCSYGYSLGKDAANSGRRISISTDSGVCDNGKPGMHDFKVAACKKGYANGVNDVRNGGSGRNTGTGGGPDTGGGGGPDTGGGADPDDGPSGTGPASDPTATTYDEHVGCVEDGVKDGIACTDPAAKEGTCDNDGCDLVGKYVNPAIAALSAAVGIAAVASLIYAGIQYTMSSGDPQKVAEAKDRISKTLIAFVFYLLLAGFLSFLIPGGLIKALMSSF